MNKKISLLLAIVSISACSHRKPDYIITDSSHKDKPIWIENIAKYEKDDDNQADKFKYFRSEAESINKRLCEQSAIANRNKAIAAEINNVADSLYNEAVEVENEESVLSNNKKININDLVRSRLVGVESRELYWEKRKYSTELGAEQDKVTYYCYNLARVKRSVHDNIINEMIKKQLQEIKDSTKKEETKEKLKSTAEDMNVELNLE